MTRGFDVITAKGSHYEIGLQYGRACAERISGFSRNLFRVTGTRFSLTPDEILARVRPYQAFGYEYAPHLMEEIRGIGDGAGLGFDEAFFLNARGELTYEREVEQCTSFALAKGRTRDGQVLVAQHVDMIPENADLGIILHLVPDDGPRILTWTIAGCVGQTGINSYGLARCGNGLFSKGIRRGLPAQLVFRLLLEQASVDSALGLFQRLERTKASNYLLGDASGAVANIEASASDFRVSRMVDGFIAHTNHFLHPDMLGHENVPERPDDIKKNSAIRLDRIRELPAAHERPRDEDVIAFLGDHAGFPNSICSHVHPGATCFQTVTSILAKPAEGRLLACNGNPCTQAYQVYTFN